MSKTCLFVSRVFLRGCKAKESKLFNEWKIVCEKAQQIVNRLVTEKFQYYQFPSTPYHAQ